jgi:hypothetical protein
LLEWIFLGTAAALTLLSMIETARAKATGVRSGLRETH